MDPNNQYPGSSQGNPYDFILNPQETPKKRFTNKGSKLAITLLLAVVGAFILTIIISVVFSSIGPKKLSKDDLAGVAQSQQELIRISIQGASDSRVQVSRNLSTTVEYTMMTQQRQVLELLSKQGLKLGKKELALKQNATTDQKFTTAKSTSTYDQTFTQVMQQMLTDYANLLKGLTAKTESQSEKDRMSEYYRQTQQIISQVPYAQNTIDSAGTTQADQ